MDEQKIIITFMNKDAKEAKLTELEKMALFSKIMKDVKRVS